MDEAERMRMRMKTRRWWDGEDEHGSDEVEERWRRREGCPRRRVGIAKEKTKQKEN